VSDLALPVRGRTLRTDTLTMIGRSVRLSRRNHEALLTSLTLPIMLMLLFVYLFGGAINTGTRYVTYVVPGVLLLCAAFGSSLTAVAVTEDLKKGVIDRFRSMDVSGASVLGGQVVASVLRNLTSTVLVFGVAFAIGFRPAADAGQWALAAGVLLLFILAVSWFLGRGGSTRPHARGGRRLHLLRDVPAVPEQRVRPHQHDAVVAARVRPAPAGHAGHRGTARAAARPAGRNRCLVSARVDGRDPGRFDRAGHRAVPAAHQLSASGRGTG
jgi:ABC-type transport system involved in cytochrome c biogenesis permease component